MSYTIISDLPHYLHSPCRRRANTSNCADLMHLVHCRCHHAARPSPDVSTPSCAPNTCTAPVCNDHQYTNAAYQSANTSTSKPARCKSSIMQKATRRRRAAPTQRRSHSVRSADAYHVVHDVLTSRPNAPTPAKTHTFNAVGTRGGFPSHTTLMYK
jgi:hypothetical protein